MKDNIRKQGAISMIAVFLITAMIPIAMGSSKPNTTDVSKQQYMEEAVIQVVVDENGKVTILNEQVTTTGVKGANEPDYKELRKKNLMNYLASSYAESEKIIVKPTGTFGGYAILGTLVYTNPWAYSTTWKSDSACVATMDKSTGVGRAYAYPIIGKQTYAGNKISNRPLGSAYRWLLPTRAAQLVIKSPSTASIDLLFGQSHVIIEVKEYNFYGQFTRSWVSDYSWTGSGSTGEISLEGFHDHIQLRLLYSYVFFITAFSMKNSPSDGFADIHISDKKAQYEW